MTHWWKIVLKTGASLEPSEKLKATDVRSSSTTSDAPFKWCFAGGQIVARFGYWVKVNIFNYFVFIEGGKIKGTLVFNEGGGGGVLWYFHTCIGSGHFLGSKIWIPLLSIFGGFQKHEFFLGYEDFVDIFWGHHKIGLYLGVIFMYFRDFS